MTQEEKAKAYDEALALMQDCIQDENGLVHVRPEEIFPELKEPEDERIRKRIIHALHGDVLDMEETNEALAWLEKQGQKETDPRYENLEELLAADDIYQMAINDDMVQEAKTKAINALSELEIGKLLGIEKQGERKLDSYCQENCKGYQETGRCFVDGECEAKESQRMISAEAKEALYDKPTWSADDEEEFKIAIETLHAAGQHSSANWLKSRKIGGKL